MENENNNPETISYIRIENENHPIDAVTIGGKGLSQIGTLVTSIGPTSTDAEYPSAACVWKELGELEQRLSKI